MITIRVTAFNGSPTSPQEATFGERGGTIGRAESSTLVLEDPQKAISRTHARVFAEGKGWIIEDRGSATPVLVNGAPLGNGIRAPIGPGDSITIGGYTLQVLPPQSAQQAFGVDLPVTGGTPKDDPLALFGGGAAAHADPFADLIPPPTPRAPAGKPALTPKASKGGIPDDFDPFGEPAAAPSGPLGAGEAQLPDDFSLDLGIGPPGKTPSVDELFDLKPGASSDPFGLDHPLGGPANRSTGGASVDPLVAIGAAMPKSSSARPTQRDDAPEIQGSFRPPEARPDPALDKNIYRSWDQDGGEIKTVIIPSPARPAPEAAPASKPAVNPQPAPRPAPPPQAPAPAPTGGSAVSDEALLRAFLEGAGVPDLQMPGGLTPQLMRVFGQLLRTATQGTLELLMARALTKRELQEPVTMIVARDNNPLKFSPSAEVAMQHLLAPRGGGFMTPLRAMTDAYDDLRAHQLGVVAGMRAALTGVLERFNPDELEKRLTQKGMLDALLPRGRKASLWDLFIKLYGDIAKEAEEDFHALFGREFGKAYEAQIQKLAGGDKSGGKV